MENDKKKEKETPRENALQKEAFEYYYELGYKRSLHLVAVKFKKNQRTIASWSGKFDWKNRVIQREQDESDGREKEELVQDLRQQYRKLFNMLISEAIKDFHAGKLRIKTISDLEKVVKMDLAIIDNPIDSMAVGTYTLSDEDKAHLDELKSGIQDLFNHIKD